MVPMLRIFSEIVLLFSIWQFAPCYSLYLDQIGKFDWSLQNLGCPHQIWFGRAHDSDVLLVVSNKNVVGRLELNTGDIVWRQVNELNAPQLELISVDHSSVQVKFDNQNAPGLYRIFDIHTGMLDSQNVVSSERRMVEEGQIKPISLDPQKAKFAFMTREDQEVDVALPDGTPVRELRILSPRKSDELIYKVVVVRIDCSLELYELSVTNSGLRNSIQQKLVWRRVESLADVSDVQLIEMPLSEAQAQIETEFNLDEPAWRSFLLRVRSQFEQLHRFFLSTAERFVQTLEMALRGELRYSAILRQLFDVGATGRRAEGEKPLERDYFNLRKVIVVTTLAGTVHGLSNDDGHVLWSFYLGSHFEPYRNDLGGNNQLTGKIPLFILRGTSFYQWASRAAIVFNVKDSKDSIVLVFNPITGEQVDQLRVLGGLSRVEMWPFPNNEQLHPLLLMRKTDSNKPEFWPSFPPGYFSPKPVYLMKASRETNTLRGFKVDLSNSSPRLIEQWLTVLPESESIYTIIGKPANQKMHSQGKVLGDRSVLYKYNNPNLVAILTMNRSHSTLGLYLLDSVSGDFVYSGRYTKATPPFNVVHCENWLVISYWNDKARRTEVGVVELFEGLQQINASTFDSLTPPYKHPIQVATQTYIFPQGISAMAATSTEQGLTSRSLLFALPFGGILEMSRRFLDARRRLEMTPELREEMVIPYMPELPLDTESLINYNQTTLNVRGIRTAPCGLESTSLVFVYGLDLFYTRVTPSGTFDILKDDFDYVLIAGVMVSLVAASVVCKRIWRYQSIQQVWA